jgi:sulfate adenylyltransferase
VLIDLIARNRLAIDIFTLDTGLLFPETHELWRRLEARYGISVRAVRPNHSVDEQARQFGERLWERNPDRCCELRKVSPLRAALAGSRAWVSAIRREQTRERFSAHILEWDERFGLAKVNPLIAWSTEDVWSYLREHAVPVNELHGRGYPSIGCRPCTTPALAGEDPRAGRWRGRGKTECGLHVGARRLAVNLTAESQPKEKEGKGPAMSLLVTPHGGFLVDRFVPAAREGTVRERARALPTLTLDARELADLELIATGAASPLEGFLGSADYQSVLERMRLANGTVWPLPLTLAVNETLASGLRPGHEAALHDGAGRLWGLIEVTEVFERDPAHEARMVYGTDDPSHPGVAYLLGRPRFLVAGQVQALPLPPDLPFAARRFTPRQLREEILARGWRRVAGFQTRNPIHRAHEHLTKLALELTDGLVIHPLVGETKNDDVPAAVRFRAYEVLLAKYYPKERTLLAAFPAAMRYAGPREAIFHALVRKNYGITDMIVGRDHAGVGKFYGPFEAQELFDRFDPAELGVRPLKLDPTFYCRACDGMASLRTCPHESSARLELSGSRVRELLRNGRPLPHEFTRPEVSEILRAHYADSGQGPGRGFIVWLTGLSGSGKSTLATALRGRLRARHPVEILDGDEVRTYLSKGLGFSKEDRDTNIGRIGYVARVLGRNGVVAIAAAISPYREARDEVRRLAASEGVPFVEVFAHAELTSLIQRDVKGLYEKALAGEISHFTGISDPYEAPANPDLVVRSDRESVEESVDRIVATLQSRGLLEAAVAQAVA